MKKLSFLVAILLFSNIMLAQTIEISEIELKAQLDSILIEGNLLYKYEKAAWVSTDLAMENKIVNKDFGGFFTYEEDGEIRVIILGKKSQNCIAEYSFESNFNKPKSKQIQSRELSDKEKDLIEVREKILENISEKEYEVTVPDGYSPNLILLPFAEKYKLYHYCPIKTKNIFLTILYH